MRLRQERDKILELRKKVLDEENDLWKRTCDKCTKLLDAVRSGELPEYTEDGKKKTWSADRKNPICDACPAHHQLRDIGTRLDDLVNYERALRG